MSVVLATCRYYDFIPPMGVPICTSVGRPKAFPYELEDVHALKPWGLMGRNMPDDEFTERYRARLDKTGTVKLWRVFHAISSKHDWARLVLLCYEDVLGRGQSCHRRSFAAWWTEQTGRRVEELSWLAGGDGRPVVVVEEEAQPCRCSSTPGWPRNGWSAPS